MLTWTKGRQKKSSYKVMKILESAIFGFDIYLIRMVEGDRIGIHDDKVFPSTLEHHRINFILKKAEVGGYFVCNGPFWSFRDRIIKFRPDKYKHQVTKVYKGKRLVFSIGWVN